LPALWVENTYTTASVVVLRRANLLRAIGEVERAALGRHAAVAPGRELLGAGGWAGHVVHLEAVLGAGDGAALLPLQQHQTFNSFAVSTRKRTSGVKTQSNQLAREELAMA
jgi:hypothetical protein